VKEDDYLDEMRVYNRTVSEQIAYNLRPRPARPHSCLTWCVTVQGSIGSFAVKTHPPARSSATLQSARYIWIARDRWALERRRVSLLLSTFDTSVGISFRNNWNKCLMAE
jgi:hypothetical protein